MSTESPLVSIILPTYNWRKEWFSTAVDSVLNQTFKDFELIIINDCSTNDIEKTILEYKGKDSRIVYVKNEKNLRLTRTLNKWLKLAKWKYIAREDDDDIWIDEKKIEKQVEFLEEHDDYWLVWTNCIIMNQDWKELYKFDRPRTDKEIRENIIAWNWIVHSSIVMRKSYLDQVWWEYDINWDYTEDYELWLRLMQICKFYNITDSYIKYRVNEKSITLSHYRAMKWNNFRLMIKYAKYYPKKYLLKWLVFRLWELIIPEKWTKYILKKFRNFSV